MGWGLSANHIYPATLLGEKMDIDLEELKRLHSQTMYIGAGTTEWERAIHNAWPAIVAKLEAAQRLRDALKLARVPIVSDCTSFSTHRPLLVTMDDALAAFDKETE